MSTITFSPLVERKNGISTFCLKPCALEKWMHQNKGEYTADYFDGCLLDNFIVCTKNGIAAVYEHYVNSNMSNYLIKFGRTKEARSQVYDEFIKNRLETYED